MKTEVPSKGLESTNLILGASLACAAFLFVALPAAAWNAGIVGVLIASCSVVALYRYGAWVERSNLALGSWAVVSPFLLGFGSVPTPMWTHVVIGLCVATIASLQLHAGSRPEVQSKS